VDKIQVTCPQCAKAYRIPADRVGHKVKCACGHTWVLAAPSVAVAGQPPEVPGSGPESGAADPTARPVKPVPVKQAAPKAPPTGPAAVARPAEPEPPKRAAPAETGAKPSREEAEARKLIGRELGTFHIDSLLGVGGFGAVYRAFDKSLRRQVAIKVLPVSMARAGKEKIQQFLLEARSAAKLSHPNIVTVHQICQAEGIYFIVMELVDGYSLAQTVRSRRLSPHEATRILTEACRGLAHAHRRGLIHRDIKPGNIIVTTDGQVKMTDFGLARDIFREPDDEELGRAVGTPLYMSPEQCDGEEGDSRSDVYSMAATYYVALTRHPPYEGRDTEEVMNRHRLDPPPDPRKLVSTLPPAVFRIIEKAMAKDPAERYQTAADLLGAMEALDFASLAPNAALSLETVSAQIGAVTPDVGTHVDAVMKEAVRRADRSTTRSRLVTKASSVSPLRWWILVGALVLLICAAAVAVAFIAASGADDKPPPTPPLSTAVGSGETTKPTTPTTPDGSPTTKPITQPPDTGETTPQETQPTGDPATVGPKEEDQPKEDDLTKAARERWERAVEYEKTAWHTNPTRVIEVYNEIARYYPNTEYAQKAKAAVERLTMADEQVEQAPHTPETPRPDEPDTPSTDGADTSTEDAGEDK